MVDAGAVTGPDVARAGEKASGDRTGPGGAAAGRCVIQPVAGSLLAAARLRGAADRPGIWRAPGAPPPP